MTIQIGDRIPDATLTTMTADGPRPVTTAELFGGMTVAGKVAGGEGLQRMLMGDTRAGQTAGSDGGEIDHIQQFADQHRGR